MIDINLIKRGLRESKGQSFINRLRYLKLLNFLSKGLHSELRHACNKYINNENVLGHYFLAHSYFLFGNFKEAKASIESFLSTYPKNDDAIYLAVDILKGLDLKEQAWVLLCDQISFSCRIKSWIVMSNLVANEVDYLKMKKLSDDSITQGLLPKNNPVFNKYLLIASLRAGRYKEAEMMAFDNFFASKSSATNKMSINSFSPSNAALALKDLQGGLQREGVEIFLVSGTLLGCVRDQSILPHDNDLDVGVWESVSKKLLIKAILDVGLFYIQTPRSPYTVRLRHVNGTPIDIFYHYIENGEVWHGGVKVRWYNTLFQLEKRQFLGGEYLIPRDYDTYLIENYGNWRVPAIDFDSAIDTPNARLINKYEMIIHILSQLKRGTSKNKESNYLVLLEKYGVKKHLLERVRSTLSS